MVDPSAPDPAACAKREAYAEAALEIAAVLAGEPDHVARMATVASMLASRFSAFLWTGFYRVDPNNTAELVVGPYQGALGCLRIAFDRGVCGRAASTRTPQVVPDVHAFPGHIACDARSRSEIVIPVFNDKGVLIAVLDVDSEILGAFDAVDVEGLERIVAGVFA